MTCAHDLARLADSISNDGSGPSTTTLLTYSACLGKLKEVGGGKGSGIKSLKGRGDSAVGREDLHMERVAEESL